MKQIQKKKTTKSIDYNIQIKRIKNKIIIAVVIAISIAAKAKPRK